MSLESLITLGDKIDLVLSYQLEQQKNGIDIEVKTFKSSVVDFLSEKNLEISMPTFDGKLVLFREGIRCEMVFYTKAGLFNCRCIVRNRYKTDNLYLLDVELLSRPTKFQRREFFRIECSIDMNYYELTKETAELESTAEIISELNDNSEIEIPKKAVILDISGGGIRFCCDQKIEPGKYVLIVTKLENSVVQNKFVLVVQIIDSYGATNDSEKYINRGKFIFKDLKDREKIVRFVFEEERKIRKKVNG